MPKYVSRATSRLSERMPKTPHIRWPTPDRRASSGTPSTLSPPTSPIRRTPTSEPSGSTSTWSCEHGDDRAAATLAEELDRVGADVHAGADAGVQRHLREAGGEPAVGRRRGRARRAARRWPDGGRAPPRPRGRARGGAAGERAVALLVDRAGQPDGAGRDEEEHVALAPRGRDPPDVGDEADAADERASGGSRSRRCRCRARRCRRRSGRRAPRRPAPCPRSTRASSQPISGFSGLPKLRPSVKPIGVAPAQATFRAASRIGGARRR